MFTIQLIDNIAPKALKLFESGEYRPGTNFSDPDVILVRSSKLHDYSFQTQLKAIGRAGVGTDNIPVAQLTELGVPVFYAPGANANAVKELVLAAMLIGSRRLDEARQFLTRLPKDNKESMNKEIESQKKKFVGHEILGKTLGIIGLGNVGVKVANAALALGMHVLAYDPTMTLQNALALMPNVEKLDDMNSLLLNSDIISLHVPLTADTTHLINEHNIQNIKPNALLLNFSREKVVSEAAIIKHLNNQGLLGYITDFPTHDLANHPKVVSFPHLGASTKEAEINSASMVIRNIRNYLEFGIIEHSINFPDTFLSSMQRPNCHRLFIINRNKPGMIAKISEKISELGSNIEQMVNSSHDKVAVNLIDITGIKQPDRLVKLFKSIPDVIRVRVI